MDEYDLMMLQYRFKAINLLAKCLNGWVPQIEKDQTVIDELWSIFCEVQEVAIDKFLEIKVS